MSGSKRLVLGAGGFLGGVLARDLRRRGADVRGFGRRPVRPHLELADMAWIEADLRDDAALDRALAGVDVVHHLLGSARPTADDGEALGAELSGTRRLLELMEARGVRRLTYASSGGTVYGPAPPLPTPETTPLDARTPYARAKAEVEGVLARAEARHGIAAVALRLGNPFGPGQSPLRGQGLVPAVLSRVMRGEPVEVWGPGAARRDYVWAGDVAEAFIAAETRGDAGAAYNIGSGVSRSVLEVVADAGRAVGLTPRVIHREARGADLPDSVLDVGLAERALGWRASARWGDSLRRTAEWLRASGFA